MAAAATDQIFEQLLEHLRRAFRGDPQTREGTAEDSDLDPIRDDPGYPA